MNGFRDTLNKACDKMGGDFPELLKVAELMEAPSNTNSSEEKNTNDDEPPVEKQLEAARLIGEVMAKQFHQRQDKEGTREAKVEAERDKARKQEEEELNLELQRIAKVKIEHEELHPPNTEECPICLETINICNLRSMVYFPCCGNGYCKSCDNEYYKTETILGQEFEYRDIEVCPLCRAEFPCMYGGPSGKGTGKFLFNSFVWLNCVCVAVEWYDTSNMTHHMLT